MKINFVVLCCCSNFEFSCVLQQYFFALKIFKVQLNSEPHSLVYHIYHRYEKTVACQSAENSIVESFEDQ